MFAWCILYSHHYFSSYYFTFQVWYLKIVQLILGLIVAGTPLSSITAAIVDFFQNIATYIFIKELPSIWFIRQCWTVILIKFQLLPAYCLSKSEKWGTLQINGTGCWQTAIINLIIKISQANDHIFLPVLISASILPEYETTVGQHDAIVLFIKEKMVATEMKIFTDYRVPTFWRWHWTTWIESCETCWWRKCYGRWIKFGSEKK